MFRILFLLSLFILFSTDNKAQSKPANTQPVSENISNKEAAIKYGEASYYADKFKGRKTANDEIYLPEKYTAACNVLPLNTWVKVTNLTNNKFVVVKINDRMHPKNKRLVDLSKAAARKINLIAYGVIRVKVEVLEGEPAEN